MAQFLYSGIAVDINSVARHVQLNTQVLLRINTTPPKGQRSTRKVFLFFFTQRIQIVFVLLFMSCADLCLPSLGYTISNINCSSTNIAKVICNWLIATSTTAKPIALSGGLQMLLGERMGGRSFSFHLKCKSLNSVPFLRLQNGQDDSLISFSRVVC